MTAGEGRNLTQLRSSKLSSATRAWPSLCNNSLPSSGVIWCVVIGKTAGISGLPLPSGAGSSFSQSLLAASPRLALGLDAVGDELNEVEKKRLHFFAVLWMIGMFASVGTNIIFSMFPF